MGLDYRLKTLQRRAPVVPFARFAVAEAGLSQLNVPGPAGLRFAHQVNQFAAFQLQAPRVGYRSENHSSSPAKGLRDGHEV